MYQEPTKADVDRNLSTILHDARHQAQAERVRLTSECAARGMASSTALIGLVVQSVDKIHAAALERAMNLLRDFVERMRIVPSQITAWARPHLENLGTTLTAEIPTAGFPNDAQRARLQYAHVFQQRLDGLLRDLEIGFIGGRSIMSEAEKSQTKALRLLQGIYDRTRNGEDPIFVTEPGLAAGFSEHEAQAAWRYLKDRGLIETFNLPYTARVNAAGIHAIEDARRHPDQPIQAFPSITYNVVNIGTAFNSLVQQGGAGSTQTQGVTYDAAERADLTRLVSEMTAHLSELKLDVDGTKKVKAQLVTLDAQLTHDPDPVIIRQAGKTIRNITEGTIAGLITTAVQPTVWSWVLEAMARLFP